MNDKLNLAPLTTYVERVDNREFNVINDFWIIGGTKARVFPAVLDALYKNGYKKFVYASSPEGLAQVALAVSARSLPDTEVHIFTTYDSVPPETGAALAETYGAIIHTAPEKISTLRDVRNEAYRWAGSQEDTYLIEFGGRFPLFRTALVETMRQLTKGWGDLRLRIWLAVGSGLLLDVLAEVLPNAFFEVVVVGSTPTEVLDSLADRVRVHFALERFWEVAAQPPPYPSVPQFDAKVWRFALLYGVHNDIIWNVGTTSPIYAVENAKRVYEEVELLQFAMQEGRFPMCDMSHVLKHSDTGALLQQLSSILQDGGATIVDTNDTDYGAAVTLPRQMEINAKIVPPGDQSYIDTLYDQIAAKYTSDVTMRCRKEEVLWSPCEEWQRGEMPLVENLYSMDFVREHIAQLQEGGIVEPDQFSQIEQMKIINAIYSTCNVCNNFKPTLLLGTLKLLYGRGYLVGDELNYLDPCAGWGDRMVGAAAFSLMTGKIVNYIGVDPNKALGERYVQLNADLMDTAPNYNGYTLSMPFEDTKLPPNMVNFVMTSPPFWTLERYSCDKDQCNVRYTTYADWRDIWLWSFVRKILVTLQKEGIAAIYISNVRSGSRAAPLADDIMQLFSENGAQFLGVVGSGRKGTPILLFKRGTSVHSGSETRSQGKTIPVQRVSPVTRVERPSLQRERYKTTTTSVQPREKHAQSQRERPKRHKTTTSVQPREKHAQSQERPKRRRGTTIQSKAESIVPIQIETVSAQSETAFTVQEIIEIVANNNIHYDTHGFYLGIGDDGERLGVALGFEANQIVENWTGLDNESVSVAAVLMSMHRFGTQTHSNVAAINRALKEGGILIISEYNVTGPEVAARIEQGATYRRESGTNYTSKSVMERYLYDMGFMRVYSSDADNQQRQYISIFTKMDAPSIRAERSLSFSAP